MMKFNEQYDRAELLGFLDGFLPEDFVKKEEDIIISKPRHKQITKAQILGASESLGLSVLEVEHGSENDPRVALATDAFKILADHWTHRALVVFKSKNSSNYRFSYLTISLDLNEKNKVIRKYSNARRYSFYLGPNAKVRTPEQQLMKKGRVKDAEDLLNRFSLEVVNKEFYLQVASAFDSLVERSSAPNLLLPSVSPEDVNVYKNFAVRLIGRVMFCWFLKQKKSESGPLISEELLSTQAVVKTRGYYHAVIEPLFFEVLNTPKDGRGVRGTLYDQVPYLNGGLFNPQRDDYYELDHGTYSSRYINTLVIQDNWFRDFFTLLETYNFTIDENTVFDQELSVDPEMLGRIFENLLAEINPETGGSERKRTGSFYTPRQIVEYMVDQSLLSYLKNKTGVTEEKLRALVSYDQEDDINNPLSDGEKARIIGAVADLRVLDPACGSGAFPVGMLQKIVYILQHVDADCSLWIDKKLQMVPDLWKQKIQEYYSSHPANYIRKLDVIKGSIFGVDIQPIAVEVSRLRCFLTLVVESKIDDSAPNRGIEPLPNLEFKFVCANALIGLPETQSRGLFDDHSGIESLSQIMSDYFIASSTKKEDIKLKFTRAQNEIFKKAFETFGQSTGELTQKLTFWDPFGNNSSSWFDPKWMFGLEEKFDVVIGNPPYGADIDNLVETYRKIYPEVIKNYADIFKIFFEFGLRMLKQDGIETFITPNTYLTQPRYKDLRQYLLKFKISRIVNLGENVFEEGVVPVCISLIKNSEYSDSYYFADASTNGKYAGIENMQEKSVSLEKVFLTKDFSLLQKFTLKEDEFIADSVLEIRDAGIQYHRSGIGLKNKGGNDLYERLFSDSVSKFENNTQVWYGKLINKYSMSEETDEYFNLDYKDILKENESVSFTKEAFAQKVKILWRQTASHVIATIDTEGRWFRNTIQCAWVRDEYRNKLDIYYVLGLFNSSYFKYLYQEIVNESAGRAFPQVKITHLRKLPIKFAKEEVQELIAGKVKEIILSKKQDKDANTTAFETQIDQLIYKLYNLTPEEIKTVEGIPEKA